MKRLPVRLWHRLRRLWKPLLGRCADGLGTAWDTMADWLWSVRRDGRRKARPYTLALESLERRELLTGNVPIAVADAYSGLHDQHLTVLPAAGVLVNDSSPHGGALTAHL